MDETLRKYEFVWRIENFNSRLPEIGNEIIGTKCFESPYFIFYVSGYTEWCLELYPKTGRDGAFIKCLPICKDYSKDSKLDCELSILDKNSWVHATKKTRSNCSAVFHCDFSNSLEVERNKLPRESDLIIRCILSSKQSDRENKNSSPDDLNELSEDLLRLYRSKQLTDLTLKIGNDKLAVHRTIVCIRAPKFAEILGIQDLENFNSVIEVRKISFAALKVLIDYLYCGKIDQDFDDILPELYEASKDYELNHLKFELATEETGSTVCTKINQYEELFNWEICQFISLNEKIFKMIDLKLARFIIYLTPSSDGFQLSFQVTTFPASKHVYLRCTMHIIDKNGSENLIGDSTFCFESDAKTKDIGVITKEKWNFPTILNKRDIISKRAEYLPQGTLNLQLRLEVTEGQKVSQLVDSKNSMKTLTSKISHLNYLSDELFDIFKVKNRPLIGGDYYDGDCYNDVILEVEKKQVFCHKSVLSARSKGFAKLLQNCARNEIKVLKINKLEHDTVLLMVQFIYSGNVSNVAVMEAAKLVVASEEYEIPSLTKKCLSLLKNSLNVKNFSEIFIFASANSNETLKLATLDYCKQNKSEVLASQEWKELMKKHPTLSKKV